MPKLTQQRLEAHLWGAANILRGRVAGQDYKAYIFTLLFFKRLSEQWEDEPAELMTKHERRNGRQFTAAQKAKLLKECEPQFKVPDGCRWADVVATADGLGAKLTDATRKVAAATSDLAGVFTVDWNQPAPDGKGQLIPEDVIRALLNHFSAYRLSSAHVPADVLGRAYEYLLKKFADDAGQAAGEFFTPPEVVDCLVRILRPQRDETVYDPTCGSGGMLVHTADFLAEHGQPPQAVRYFGQELNWQTFAIARINTILHGLEATLAGGRSTLTDPAFLTDAGGLKTFDVVIANFPFSAERWWLGAGQAASTKQDAASVKKSHAAYTDPFGRFTFGKPPAGYGDYAFIQHIVASLAAGGRAGVVCPQGVLFRGQPAVEEETDELDRDGNPKVKRRKADDEHLIRAGLLAAGLVEAVIALPLNIFYGAGVPACLLVLNKRRPLVRKDKVLLVYAARHYRELSAKNQLRPRDVMRILVHYHAYGEAAAVPGLLAEHGKRLMAEVQKARAEAVGLAEAEYEEAVARTRSDKALAKLAAERDQKLAEADKLAAEELAALQATVVELRKLYADPAELARHARVVNRAEIAENEFNLNIPRYVDTFEPEEPIDVAEALRALDAAERERATAEKELRKLLAGCGYGC